MEELCIIFQIRSHQGHIWWLFNFLPDNTSCSVPSVSLIAMSLTLRAKKRLNLPQPQQSTPYGAVWEKMLSKLEEMVVSTNALGMTEGDNKKLHWKKL